MNFTTTTGIATNSAIAVAIQDDKCNNSDGVKCETVQTENTGSVTSDDVKSQDSGPHVLIFIIVALALILISTIREDLSKFN